MRKYVRVPASTAAPVADPYVGAAASTASPDAGTEAPMADPGPAAALATDSGPAVPPVTDADAAAAPVREHGGRGSQNAESDAPLARFSLVYESRDQKLCLFELPGGRLQAASAERLA